MSKLCQVINCDRFAYKRGWCRAHYDRWLKHKDIQADNPIRQQNKQSVCSVSDCQRPHVAKGLCRAHWERQQYGQGVQADKPLRQRLSDVCMVEGCSEPYLARGYCRMHYQRTKIHGDPQVDIPNRRNGFMGTVNAGYRVFTRNGQQIREHRLVMEESIGRTLHTDETVHHKNGDRLDNRLDNLELWASRHPKGQRVTDLIEFALDILERYADMMDNNRDRLLQLAKGYVAALPE